MRGFVVFVVFCAVVLCAEKLVVPNFPPSSSLYNLSQKVAYFLDNGENMIWAKNMLAYLEKQAGKSEGNYDPIPEIKAEQQTAVDPDLEKIRDSKRGGNSVGLGSHLQNYIEKAEYFEAKLAKGEWNAPGLPFKSEEEMKKWILECRRVVSEAMNALGYETKISDVFDVNKRAIMEGGWQFKLPAQFADMSLKQIEKELFGSLVPINKEEKRKQLRDSGISEVMLEIDGDDDEAAAELPIPESYDFFQEFPRCRVPPRQQGRCGSCWAFASTGAAGHRLCRKMSIAGWSIPDNFRLSPQGPVSCVPQLIAPSGNGCLGGYILRAMPFLSGRKTPEESSFEYQSGTKGEDRKDLCSQEEDKRPRWGPFGATKNLGSIPLEGGQRMRAMQRSIMNEGPLMVTMRVPRVFMGYRGRGVFQVNKNESFVSGQSTEGNPVHAIHAIVIVGWGVEDNIPYWLVENSWGSLYEGMPAGYEGFFKILRGENHCEIEDDALAVTIPDLPSTEPDLNRPTPRTPDFTFRGPCGTANAMGACTVDCPGGNIIPNMSGRCADGQSCCKVATKIPPCNQQHISEFPVCASETECRKTERTRIVSTPGLCFNANEVCCMKPPAEVQK